MRERERERKRERCRCPAQTQPKMDGSSNSQFRWARRVPPGWRRPLRRQPVRPAGSALGCPQLQPAGCIGSLRSARRRLRRRFDLGALPIRLSLLLVLPQASDGGDGKGKGSSAGGDRERERERERARKERDTHTDRNMQRIPAKTPWRRGEHSAGMRLGTPRQAGHGALKRGKPRPDLNVSWRVSWPRQDTWCPAAACAQRRWFCPQR